MKCLLPALMLACGGPDPATCAGPAPGASQRAAVLTTLTERFDAGTLTVVDLHDGAVCDGVAAATGDSVVRVVDGRVLQIDRLRHDRFRVIEPGRWDEPQIEFSVGRGANPHDAVRCGDRWLISLYEEDALGVFDDRGARVASVDLRPHADDDGLPEPSAIVSDGERAWVALQRLTRQVGGFEPEQPGRIVEVSCDDWTVTDHVQAPPNASIATGGDGRYRVWGADGRLLTFDPDADGLQPLLTVPDPIATTAFAPSGYGVVLVRDARLWHTLSCVDPAGDLTPLLTTSAFLPDLRADDQGIVWVAVRRGWADLDTAPSELPVYHEPRAGLWRIDPVACALIDEAPLQTELPPYSIAFY